MYIYLYLNSRTRARVFEFFASYQNAKIAQTCSKFDRSWSADYNSIKIARNLNKFARGSIALGRPTHKFDQNCSKFDQKCSKFARSWSADRMHVPKRAEPQIRRHGQCFVRVGISIHPSDFVRKTDSDDLGTST